MQQVHEYMTLPPDFQLREVGTQEYEADVVTLERYGGNTVHVAGQRTNTFVNEMSRKSNAGVHTCVCLLDQVSRSETDCCDNVRCISESTTTPCSPTTRCE